jgi:arylsulfatase
MIYHENVNVPMIIVHPDVKGGSTSDALFSAVDLAPTLLGLGSIEDARQRTEFPVLKGYDLSEAVANPGKPGRRDTEVGGLLYTYDSLNSVDVEFMSHVDVFLREGAKSLTLTIPPNLKPNFRENRGFLRGVYDGRYKLARYFAPAKCNRPKTLEDLFHDNDVELYDTQTDPEEVNNLAADREKNSAKLIELNAKLELLIESEIGKDREVHFPDLKELRPMPFQR